MKITALATLATFGMIGIWSIEDPLTGKLAIAAYLTAIIITALYEIERTTNATR
jgi:hypothetical protein